MVDGFTAILLEGMRQAKEEAEWAGKKPLDPEAVLSRGRMLTYRIGEVENGRQLPKHFREEIEVDLARAAERPEFFGLAEPPQGEIPDVDTSPSASRNMLVQEMRRINGPPPTPEERARGIFDSMLRQLRSEFLTPVVQVRVIDQEKHYGDLTVIPLPAKRPKAPGAASKRFEFVIGSEDWREMLAHVDDEALEGDGPWLVAGLPVLEAPMQTGRP